MQPIQNLSYAVDFQTLEWKRHTHKKGERHTLPGHFNILEMSSHYNLKEDREEPVFHIYQGYEQGNPGKPSEVTDRYWLQGPTNYNTHRWEDCTSNSGKFCLCVDPKKVDQVWERFLQAHIKGELGMGLRCSTAKPNAWAGLTYLITVHVPDCDDLRDIERVSRNCFRLLDDKINCLRLTKDLFSELNEVKTTVIVHKFVHLDSDEKGCFEILMDTLDNFSI